MPIIPELNFTPGEHRPSTGSATVAAAPGRAAQSVARGLNEIAESFKDVAITMRRTEDARTLSGLRSAWTNGAAVLEQQFESDPDPQSQVKRSEEFLAKTRKELDAAELSPAAREQALLQHEEWSAQVRTRTAGGAARLSRTRAELALQNELTDTMNRRDRPAFEAALTTAVDGGLVLPERADFLRISFDRAESISRVEDLIRDNPREAIRQLSSPDFLDSARGFGEDDRKRSLEHAERELQIVQRKAIEDINSGIVTRNIATEEKLEEVLAAEPDLEDVWKDELRFNFIQGQPVDAETRFAITDQLNALHDEYAEGEMPEDSYRAAHDEVARLVFALGAREGTGALRSRLAALDPANWDGRTLKIAAADARGKVVEEIGKLYGEQGVFGRVDETAEPAERARQATEIHQTRQKFENKIKKWAMEHPEKDEEAIGAKFHELHLKEGSAQVLGRPEKDGPARARSLAEVLDEGTKMSFRTEGGPGAAGDMAVTLGRLAEVVKILEAGGTKEGYHAKAYWDHGQWSIGYGTKSKAGETITREEAAKRLDGELAMHRQRVEKEARACGLSFEPHELDALTSFDFNTGSIGQLLAGGTRTKAEIASKMLLYRMASGKVLRGLERRRIVESNLFRRGYR